MCQYSRWPVQICTGVCGLLCAGCFSAVTHPWIHACDVSLGCWACGVSPRSASHLEEDTASPTPKTDVECVGLLLLVWVKEDY